MGCHGLRGPKCLVSCCIAEIHISGCICQHCTHIPLISEPMPQPLSLGFWLRNNGFNNKDFNTVEPPLRVVRISQFEELSASTRDNMGVALQRFLTHVWPEAAGCCHLVPRGRALPFAPLVSSITLMDTWTDSSLIYRLLLKIKAVALEPLLSTGHKGYAVRGRKNNSMPKPFIEWPSRMLICDASIWLW